MVPINDPLGHPSHKDHILPPLCQWNGGKVPLPAQKQHWWACASNTWLLDLLLVLLGIHASLKVNLKCTTAELVYSTTLCLPGDFFLSSYTSATTVPDPLSYVEGLKSTMSHLTATPPHHPSKSPFWVPANLSSYTPVFIRHNAVRQTLKPPYNGPFILIKHKPMYYTIRVNGKPQSVSFDRLKPSFPLNDESLVPAVLMSQPSPTISTSMTHSVHRVRWPDCLTWLCNLLVLCPYGTLGGVMQCASQFLFSFLHSTVPIFTLSFPEIHQHTHVLHHATCSTPGSFWSYLVLVVLLRS